MSPSQNDAFLRLFKHPAREGDSIQPVVHLRDPSLDLVKTTPSLTRSRSLLVKHGSISKKRTLLSSATTADEGDSHPSPRLVMIRYDQRASMRLRTITYDSYWPATPGPLILYDHCLPNAFKAVSVSTKRSVHIRAQELLSQEI